ncbi:MAG TPA: FecR family protein [Gammaproteobacteria bacterium]|nr:FecR family protein [Gammaproteobacteria bacterium]
MSNERDSEQRSERALTQLFQQAAPRPMPPAEDAEAIRRAVYAEWEALTGRQHGLRRAGFAAVAAVVLAAIVWVGTGLVPSTPPAAVARVERVQGIIDTDLGMRLEVGTTLVAGDSVSTRTGQVALRLASGGSLRVGPRTDLVLSSADAAELTSGSLYFDSESRRAGVPFSVTTPRGTVSDVGTQFVVRLDGERAPLDVGVRDGRVLLMTKSASGMAEAGERLIAAVDTTAIRRETMVTFGADWDWADELAPPFDIDGRTVNEFLSWFSRQTGRSVVFGSDAAERLARETRLSGSIDLAPLQKLSAVLTLTDLTYALEDERVVIETR